MMTSRLEREHRMLGSDRRTGERGPPLRRLLAITGQRNQSRLIKSMQSEKPSSVVFLPFCGRMVSLTKPRIQERPGDGRNASPRSGGIALLHRAGIEPRMWCEFTNMTSENGSAALYRPGS